MGNRGTYWRTARFTEHSETDLHWKTVGTLDSIKILKHQDKPNCSLPEFAKTSKAYIGVAQDGRLTVLRVYEKGFPSLEFDLGHPHHHGMTQGAVHVHHYVQGPDGNPVRDPRGRKPTDREWEAWGGTIREMERRNAS